MRYTKRTVICHTVTPFLLYFYRHNRNNSHTFDIYLLPIREVAVTSRPYRGFGPKLEGCRMGGRLTADTLVYKSHTHAWVCIFWRKGVRRQPVYPLAFVASRGVSICIILYSFLPPPTYFLSLLCNKIYVFVIFLRIFLHMSKKNSNFAPQNMAHP